jgi:hypothetical protein
LTQVNEERAAIALKHLYENIEVSEKTVQNAIMLEQEHASVFNVHKVTFVAPLAPQTDIENQNLNYILLHHGIVVPGSQYALPQTSRHQ